VLQRVGLRDDTRLKQPDPFRAISDDAAEDLRECRARVGRQDSVDGTRLSTDRCGCGLGRSPCCGQDQGIASHRANLEPSAGPPSLATVAIVRDYYEQLWERLPHDLAAPDWELRRAFLLLHVHSGDRVLDLGSGDGRFTAEASSAGAHVIGADVAQAAVDRGREQHPALDFQLVPIDGPLPFGDNEFDLVWASEVIEHVPDTARWLSEVRRVLLPGGRLLVTTPSHGRLRVALAGVERFSEPLGDHLHLYTRNSLRTLLIEFGFGDVSVRTRGGPPLLRHVLLARGVR
jgi:SAM-dependent methyltransferase